MKILFSFVKFNFVKLTLKEVNIVIKSLSSKEDVETARNILINKLSAEEIAALRENSKKYGKTMNIIDVLHMSPF